MSIPAQQWNRMVDFIFRHRVKDVRVLDPVQWRSPWHTTVAWSPDREQWEATVKPGFVNGIDPMTVDAVAVAEKRDITERGLADLETPRIALTTWRTPSPVPEYFVKRGVAASVDLPTVDTLLETGLPQVATPTQQPSRIVLAMDIVLHQPRAASRVDYQTTTAGGADGVGLRYQISYSGGLGRPYVRAVRELIPDPPLDLASLIDGSKADAGIDRKLVATVYVLSPEGVLEGEPDASWTAHVKHELFWNLTYHATGTPGASSDDLRLDVPLAGGIAQPLIGQILASVNDANSAVAQFLSARVAAGKWWSV